MASTTIEVAGTAVGEEGGGQGPRDEDDPLAGPAAIGLAGLSLEPARHDQCRRPR